VILPTAKEPALKRWIFQQHEQNSTPTEFKTEGGGAPPGLSGLILSEERELCLARELHLL
jgi:hypothetical protein